MTKSVCIVGAGPSGLVAAKTLLHDVSPGTFKVTIYEAQSRIGGLWPLSKNDNAGLVHPLMVANQSKHTVQFSDFAWDDTVPQLPRAWQVGQYLDRYLQRYDGADVRLNHRVVRTELQDAGTWKVETESEKGAQTSVFDYLLVTTGFFGKPMWPENMPGGASVPVVHSSKYRDLESLLQDGDSQGSKILVPDATAPPFLPCDLPAYNKAVRPQPLKNTQGHISVDAAKAFNLIYQSVLGTDQEDFSAQIKIGSEFHEQQPFLAMSSQYADFVRSGLITVSHGKVSALSGTSASVEPSGEEIRDIAAVVVATGFDPAQSLKFLPPEVLETISYSPSHPTVPAALAFHGTHHPALPTLGFVGFYRSPYWGVMEMQARFVTELWTSCSKPSALADALAKDDTIQRMAALRTDPRASQFPMGDYVYLMQEFAKALEMDISAPRETPPLANGKSMDIITPARYAPKGATEVQMVEVDKNLASTQQTALAGLTKGKFVAYAVFRSLLGEWRLERDLVSRLPSHPSGRFVGTAKFLLREGTNDGRHGSEDTDLGMEYLYVEDGDFIASNGMTFRATRRYVWRYDELKDVLSVWFAQTEDHMRADYLFHDIEFIVPDGEGSSKGWQARASHLCIEDLYDVHYEFQFKAVNLKKWSLGYTVKGPKKDYTIAGQYSRF
ncbi:uncharacterized protein JN550_003341 [Neoarthrinium moseri]|uniref:uncharacterized protein n=1 Tax=Neoarthrinium moseri TaxID=1658444 RepID=UPI001FDD06B0|nr:uncharacterized protein JN550_003341 [Neoarthrinium moseri]KAI1873088.1 hypothetical protein JN550_003341 [Neoarthrinium moseri]